MWVDYIVAIYSLCIMLTLQSRVASDLISAWVPGHSVGKCRTRYGYIGVGQFFGAF